MKNLIFIMLCWVFQNSTTVAQQKIATFKGIQVTGLTVTASGRMFANFPRWRDNVPFSVVEVFQNGTYQPYPDKQWNTWHPNQTTTENNFIAIQSVVAHNNELYVLETNNPQFQGVINPPKIYVFDLETNTLLKTYRLTEGSYYKNSYINDLRIDSKRNWIYLTDSGVGGIVILDRNSETSKRYLDQHKVTSAETDFLHCSNGKWKNTVHSDGIEFDPEEDLLYFHALTGYTLYGITINNLLNNDTSSIYAVKTAAPDGLARDEKGNIYFGDLENNKIMYITKEKKIKTLSKNENKIKWPDTFSIYKNHLYYTNSRINEAAEDISNLEFSIWKIKLP